MTKKAKKRGTVLLTCASCGEALFDYPPPAVRQFRAFGGRSPLVIRAMFDTLDGRLLGWKGPSGKPSRLHVKLWHDVTPDGSPGYRFEDHGGCERRWVISKTDLDQKVAEARALNMDRLPI